MLQYRDSAKAEKAIDLAHYYLDPFKISEGIIWWLSIPISGKFVLKGLDVRQKWPFSMFPLFSSWLQMVYLKKKELILTIWIFAFEKLCNLLINFDSLNARSCFLPKMMMKIVFWCHRLLDDQSPFIHIKGALRRGKSIEPTISSYFSFRQKRAYVTYLHLRPKFFVFCGRKWNLLWRGVKTRLLFWL